MPTARSTRATSTSHADTDCGNPRTTIDRHSTVSRCRLSAARALSPSLWLAVGRLTASTAALLGRQAASAWFATAAVAAVPDDAIMLTTAASSRTPSRASSSSSNSTDADERQLPPADADAAFGGAGLPVILPLSHRPSASPSLQLSQSKVMRRTCVVYAVRAARTGEALRMTCACVW